MFLSLPWSHDVCLYKNQGTQKLDEIAEIETIGGSIILLPREHIVIAVGKIYQTMDFFHFISFGRACLTSK